MKNEAFSDNLYFFNFCLFGYFAVDLTNEFSFIITIKYELRRPIIEKKVYEGSWKNWKHKLNLRSAGAQTNRLPSKENHIIATSQQSR